MKTPLRFALLAAVLTLPGAHAADQTTAPEAPTNPQPASLTPSEQQKLEAAIRERLAEHTLEKAAKKAPATHPIAPPEARPGQPAATTVAAAAPTAATKDDATLLLPRVEVNQSRITELMIKEREKEREIAREKKNTKPTAADEALNDTKVSHALALFGGSSAEDRARVAEERVSLLEAEKDLLDEIARAPTKEERAALETQLNELKKMRRELDRAPREERK